MEKIHKECQLEEIVEGDEVENESGELIYDVEETKHDPVSKPLCSFSFDSGLESQKAHESGVRNGNDAGDVACSNAEHDQCAAKIKTVFGNLFL